MKRRITKARIKFLSLVPKGANRLPAIYKEDGAFELAAITKAGADFAEKGELLSVVYAPELRDSQGDIASATVVKEMCHEAARAGLEVDIRHNGEPVGRDKAFVAESFLVQKGDPRFSDMMDFDGNPVDVTGAWASLIKIDDPELRELYKSGEWAGVSMGGVASLAVEKADDDDITRRVIAFLTEKMKLNVSAYGSIEMTPQELAEALTKNNEAIAKSIGDVVAAAIAKIVPPKTETPPAGETPPVPGTVLKFEGEPTPANLRAFRKKLAIHKANEAVDWTDTKSVETFETALVKIEKDFSVKAADEPTDAEAGIEKDDSDEVRTLKLDLAKAQRRTNQPSGTADTTPASGGTRFVGLTKEDDDLAALGTAIAKGVNGARG